MGIDNKNLQFLQSLYFRPGATMLTLGRQHWCVEKKKLAERPFSEELLKKYLQLSSVDSIDISHEESPTYVLDLNYPLPPEMPKYDIIYDGGTLEHCFNPLQALDNLIPKLNLNGWFVSTKLLNLSGHGLWCFTPEFLQRWAVSRGFVNTKFEVFRLGPFALRWPLRVPLNARTELASVVPLHLQFAAQYIDNKVDRSLFEVQAGPNTKTTSALKYWLVDTKLWGNYR